MFFAIDSIAAVFSRPSTMVEVGREIQAVKATIVVAIDLIVVRLHWQLPGL